MAGFLVIGTQVPRTATPPTSDFATSIEPLLFILGGAMTIAVGIFLIWLIRQMIREDRAQGHDDRGGA